MCEDQFNSTAVGQTMGLRFMFLSYQMYLIVNGVFGDEVKSVSVKSGHSVTLHTDVVKQRDDLIVWYYGPERTVVAIINGEANSIKFSKDERFKDRVKLNDQTGDLNITHITSQHSGLYTLRISRNMKVSDKTFNLTVNCLPFPPPNQITNPTQDPDNTRLNNKSSESPDQRLIVITAVVVSVLCVIIIISIIIYMKKRMAVPRNSSDGRNLQTDEKRSINNTGHLKMKKCQGV